MTVPTVLVLRFSVLGLERNGIDTDGLLSTTGFLG